MKRSLKKLPALLALLSVLGAGWLPPRRWPSRMRRITRCGPTSMCRCWVSMDAAALETEIDSLETHYEDFEQQVALYPYNWRYRTEI